MQLSFLIVTLLGGIALAVQVGLNSVLRNAFGNATAAVLVNFLVGLLALLVVARVMRVPLAVRDAVTGAPWWAWLGGILGAFYVTVAVLMGPRIGITALLALTVAGQLLAALAMDHYGLLGMAQQSITVAKLAGSALLIAGVLLIVR